MSQLFWPTHIDKLETLRTYASVLYKQFKIDFSFAQHYVQLLFLNALQLIIPFSCLCPPFMLLNLVRVQVLVLSWKQIYLYILISSEYQGFPPPHQYKYTYEA